MKILFKNGKTVRVSSKEAIMIMEKKKEGEIGTATVDRICHYLIPAEGKLGSVKIPQKQFMLEEIIAIY